MKDIIRVWKEKNKILEGIKNNIFKKADVEHIAAERMDICDTCPHLDTKGDKCLVPGTGPCCALCGCSLSLKTRALSASCDAEKWKAILNEDEQEQLDRHIAVEETNTSNNENNI
jgi:hypothetical protein